MQIGLFPSILFYFIFFTKVKKKKTSFLILDFLSLIRVCEAGTPHLRCLSNIFLSGLGQSGLKSRKSAELIRSFGRAAEGLLLRGSLAGSSVAARPSSSFDYISNTV